jgi:hypothetical protein
MIFEMRNIKMTNYSSEILKKSAFADEINNVISALDCGSRRVSSILTSADH